MVSWVVGWLGGGHVLISKGRWKRIGLLGHDHSMISGVVICRGYDGWLVIFVRLALSSG